ncbi:MAG: transcriptional regulator with XRE-family HTH domain, partial [Rickettsiales bacterium]
MNNDQNYKDVLRNLGLRMQLFRKQKNLTQEEMAFRINKSKD